MTGPALPGGSPPALEVQRAQAQDAQLRAVVAEAVRLIPPGTGGIAGAGAGGVSPQVVDAVVRSLLDLRTLTDGEGLGILDWLSTGLATAPPGDPGDITTSAMRIRDLLMEALIEFGDGQPDGLTDSEASLRAAIAFAEGAIEVRAQ